MSFFYIWLYMAYLRQKSQQQMPPPLELLNPKLKQDIEEVFCLEDSRQNNHMSLVMSYILSNIKRIRDIDIFIRLAIASKRFYNLFWKNPRVLHLLYTSFHQAHIDKGVLNVLPDIEFRVNYNEMPSNWKDMGAMNPEELKKFVRCTRKIFFLGYAQWCNYCHQPLYTGLTESVPLWYYGTRACVHCCREKLFISDRALKVLLFFIFLLAIVIILIYIAIIVVVIIMV